VVFEIEVHCEIGRPFIDAGGAGGDGDEGIDTVGGDTLTEPVVLGLFVRPQFPP